MAVSISLIDSCCSANTSINVCMAVELVGYLSGMALLAILMGD